MNEHPILFSAPMVRALLDGRKVQTRRIIKGAWLDRLNRGEGHIDEVANRSQVSCGCPYGVPGDKLWVRETWGVGSRPDPWGGYDGIEYRADEGFIDPEEKYPTLDCYKVETPEGVCLNDYKAGWHSPIFMPRWASRITLEITDVRVQRLQEISEEDASAEGVDSYKHIGKRDRNGDMYSTESYAYRFRELWDTINAKRGFAWSVNPWVWALTFSVLASDVEALMRPEEK
jgi:hypothetical protein